MSEGKFNDILKQIRIRQFKDSDLLPVQIIFADGMLNGHAIYPEQSHRENYVARILQLDMADIQRSYMEKEGCNFWVAEDISSSHHSYHQNKKLTSKIIGCVAVSRYNELKNEHRFIFSEEDVSRNKIFELHRMSVHADFRGKGVAQALLATLENYAFVEQEGDKIFLSTLNEMKSACRFYDKQGFTRIGSKQIPIKHPDNELLNYEFCVQYFEKSKSTE